jgi:hypothetical protein
MAISRDVYNLAGEGRSLKKSQKLSAGIRKLIASS